MAATWVRARSLSCKSRAVADDVYSPPPKKHPPPQAKRSVAVKPAKDTPRPIEHGRHARTKKKNMSELAWKKPKQLAAAASPSRPSSAAFLAMTELPEGHPSRCIVELIFESGWGPHDAQEEAEVEALFRVRSTPCAVARFEDARAAARAQGEATDDARCAADGNEMMRFQCRAADGDSVICAAVATTKLSAVRTFGGSGAAHAGAGAGDGGAQGRRAMLVCRVIAGRVHPASDPACHAGEYHSVDAGGGELVVLDSRAVLPCFLVVYRVKPALDSKPNQPPSPLIR